MVKNAFFKDSLRQIVATKHRFLSILIITALGVAFFAGLRATGPSMRVTASDYWDQLNFMDIRLVSTVGFDQDDLNAVKSVEGVDAVMPAYAYDALAQLPDQNLTIRFHSLSEDGNTGHAINRPQLLEGRMPASSGETVADPRFLELSGYGIGDTVQFASGTAAPVSGALKTDIFQIVGVAENPLYISEERGTSSVGSGKTEAYFLILPDDFEYVMYTEIYLTIDNDTSISRFDDAYADLLAPVKEALEETGRLQAELRGQEIPLLEWYALDINTNIGFVSYKQDTERIDALSLVLPILFFLVAVLVTMTSMTRLVDSDRSYIGTFKSMGYTSNRIALRYLLYAMTASISGSVIGVIAGLNVFPRVAFSAYASLYTLPSIQIHFQLQHALVSMTLAIACAALPAYLVCIRSMREVPAELVRPVAPPVSKSILLERIPFVWRRFNFSQKVALRNLFRYKKRLLMTVFGVAGCTALIFTGFGMHDSITTIVPKQYGTVQSFDLQLDLTQNSPAADRALLDEALENNPDILATTELTSQPVDILHGSQLKSVLLSVPAAPSEFANFIRFQDRSSQQLLQFEDNSVIITEKLADLLDLTAGSHFTIRDGSGNQAVVVVGGIMENYLSHYIYMTPALYRGIFDTEPVVNQILSHLQDSSGNGNGNNTISQSLMAYAAVSSVTLTTNLRMNIEAMVEALRYVMFVLILSAAALLFVVLFSLTTINMEERSRELATIKVLGFYDKELAAYMYRENVVLTVMGTAAGLLLGVILQRYIIITMEVDMLMFSRDLLWQSYAYSAALTVFFAALVNIFLLRHIARIDMVSSLKSIE